MRRYTYHADEQNTFTTAQNASNLMWTMSGVLGKRTKFQTFDVAQLVVMAESSSVSSSPAVKSAERVPSALPLNDDTLLERVEFKKNEDGFSDSANEKHVTKQRVLKQTDQCLLLAFWYVSLRKCSARRLLAHLLISRLVLA
jgi:hypothetical protein